LKSDTLREATDSFENGAPLTGKELTRRLKPWL
jgi:hypothetical protein